MNFFHHKDLGNHLLQLCPKVVKHPVYFTYSDSCSYDICLWLDFYFLVIFIVTLSYFVIIIFISEILFFLFTFSHALPLTPILFLFSLVENLLRSLTSLFHMFPFTFLPSSQSLSR